VSAPAPGAAPARPPRLPALLAAALLAATLVGVPVQIYRAAALDFASASRDLLLAVFAAGLVAFAVLALVFLLAPAGLRRSAGPLLVAVAAYAWARSGFFPGPSVNLDGTAVTADLSTGWAGLLVPVAAGALLGALAVRRPRDAASVLAVLLAGSIVQSLATAASAWGSKAPTPGSAAASSLFEWSRRGNVLVLVLDAFQSDVFEDVLQAEPRLRDDLDGFRYYRLASSTAPTTYLSVPTIHGGFGYRPGQSVLDFYDEAIVEGSVLNRLARAGYRTSYSSIIGKCPRSVDDCTATVQLARTRVELLATEAAKLVDLGLYRVLPDAPRQAVLRQGRGPIAVLTGWTPLLDDAFVQLAALERLRFASTVTDSAPTAKMVHTTLTHPPGMLRADCSTGERRFDREAVRLQSQCAMRQVVGLFQRLRSGGAYDVTTIVILADHGYTFESTRAVGSKDPKFRRMVGSFNPTVLVKPAGARGPLTTSDAPIEIPDLPRALCGERECQPADVLRRLDEVDARRRRGIFWYTWNNSYWGMPQIPGLARYWIEGDLFRVDSWSRESASYEPGDPIEFRRGGNLGAYVGFGWARREATETAMADPQATVWLRGRFDPSREHLLVIEARPVGDLEPGSPAKVAVSVNGIEVGQIAALGAGARFETYRFAVPASVLSRSPDTLIRFSAQAPGAAPGRETARLSLRSLELRPQTPPLR
jgi:hypothetical protein